MMPLSLKRGPVGPIPESVRLTDALAGFIRLRANDGKNGKSNRRAVKDALVAAGIPMHPLSDLSLVVRYGTLVTFRFSDDVTEYVWAPEGADRREVRPSTVKVDGDTPQGMQFPRALRVEGGK